jgi:hypothetical protein
MPCPDGSWLVQEDVLRALHEHLRQSDPHLPAPLNSPQRRRLRGEAESADDAADACGDTVPVERVEPVEQLALFLDQRVEIALPALDECRHVVQPVVDGARLREGGPELVHERPSGFQTRLLPQETDGAAAVAGRALVGFVLAGQQLEEGRFPGPVGPDEADALGVTDDEGEIGEHIEAAERT